MTDKPKSIYRKLLEAENESTRDEIFAREKSKQIRVHMPCEVVAVHANTVDVKIQGKEDSGYGFYVDFPILLNLPVIYNNYTRKAYIITPIQVGDTGLVEFLDFNSSAFNKNGKPALTQDQIPHSLNNGVFINGFIPTSKVIEIDNIEDNAITIGLRNKNFKLDVDDTGSCTISGISIKLKSGADVTVDTPNFYCSGSLGCANGASGVFSSTDGKTITVTDGIITSIE